MGQAELEAALRKDGDTKANNIWTVAEAEAEQLRCTIADTLNRETAAEQARCEAQIVALQVEKQATLERRIQRCRLDAEAALAERLFRLAVELLEGLAEIGGEQLFQALVAEIPTYDWMQVRVNQRDQAQAAENYPGAEIVPSAEISAGLEVQDGESRIRIINTLEKRCAHLWPELLPELMAELRQRTGENGTAG